MESLFAPSSFSSSDYNQTYKVLAMEETHDTERPSKRIKLDSDDLPTTTPTEDIVMHESKDISPLSMALPTETVDSKNPREIQATKEAQVGIIGYVYLGSEGFTGILKKRYTDFLVNEVLPNGEVCHLKNLKVPKLGRKDAQNILRGDNGEASGHEVKIEGREKVAEEDPVPAKAEAKQEQNGDAIIHVERNGTLISDDAETLIKKEEGVVKPPADAKEPPKEGEISDDDKAFLVEHLGESAIQKLLNLQSKIFANPNIKPKDHGTVLVTDFTPDRTIRGVIHQAIRRIFNSRIDSSTDAEGQLILSASLPSFRQPRNQPGRGGYGGGSGRDRGPKLTWADRGGDYLHFSLFKENKDTMEVISFLSRQLKTNAKAFQFAGTKDRRAVTVQRVSVYRLEADRVAGVNRMLRGGQLGDFEYQTHGLELGDLTGNEFVITLRECNFPSIGMNYSMAEMLSQVNSMISATLTDLNASGFINYYGLQRFGTFSTRTDTIGVALLQGDFKAACDLILAYAPDALAAAEDVNGGSDRATNSTAIGQDDKNRAFAIHMFQEGKRDLNKILDILPRKFSAESNIIRRLHRQPTDYAGALQMIPRNLKMMYVHAYQSLVWNFAASKRWKVYGGEVVEGDLVLVNEHKDKVEIKAEEEIDIDGEMIVKPDANDRSNTADEMFERARPLSAADATSGQYSIFDIVLPQPGFDVLYPSNAIGDFYKSFMGSKQGGGLDPDNMRRKQRDFSLSGSYRKVMARIGKNYEVQVKAYREDGEQFVETDLEKLRKAGGAGHGYQGLPKKEGEEAKEGEGDKIAVVLKLQLGSSQYATMALRELTKGGVEAHKPDFGGRG